MSTREQAVRERHRWADALRLLAVVALGGTLTLLAAGSLRQAEALRLAEHRDAAADGIVQTFRQEWIRMLEGLRTAALMMEVHPQLSRDQFNAYMRGLVEDQLSISVVEWQPIVAARDLEAFEDAVRADGLPDFAVVEPDASRQGWQRVSGRDPYVVVRYAWPESYRTIGLDMSFSPERMASKLQSEKTGEPVASGAFEFMKQGMVRSGSTAIAISTTVFGPGRSARGYLAAVVDLPTLFAQASERARDVRLDLRVLPSTAPDATPVFTTASAAAGAAAAVASGAHADAPALSRVLELAGQRWRLVFEPQPGFYAGVSSRVSLWTLVAGVAMTLLLAWAVTRVQAGRRRVEQAERATARANDSLRIQSDRLLQAQRVAHLGSWDADLARGTVSWSPELRALLGLDPRAVPEAVADQRPRFTDESWDRFQEALLGAPSAGSAFEVELEAVRPDGSRRWLLFRGVAEPAGERPATEVHGVAMDITSRKRAELKIENLAFTDSLTGLPNRRLLVDRLVHALAFAERHRCHGAVLFVDLDGFKEVNDNFGHERGDLLLQQVARRLTDTVRKGDTVGRLGGDEFVVLLEEIGGDPAEAADHARIAGGKLLEALAAPYALGADRHRCTASIGAALFGPERLRPDVLLRRADMAMYRAKALGRNSLSFFEPSMLAASPARAPIGGDGRDGR